MRTYVQCLSPLRSSALVVPLAVLMPFDPVLEDSFFWEVFPLENVWVIMVGISVSCSYSTFRAVTGSIMVVLQSASVPLLVGSKEDVAARLGDLTQFQSRLL
jgi:hypothetical protein